MIRSPASGPTILAVLVGACLTLPAIARGPLVLDEYVSIWFASTDSVGSIWQRTVEASAVPPLSAWWQWLWLQVPLSPEIALRLSSILPFLLAMIVVDRAAATWFSPSAGPVAAWCLALHPDVLDEVRLGRPYGLLVLWGACAIWSCGLCLKQPQRRGYWFGWMLVQIALIWTHYTTVLFVPLEICLLTAGLIMIPTHRLWIISRLLPAVAGIGLFGFPLLVPFFRTLEWSPFLNFMTNPAPIWMTISPMIWLGIPLALLVSQVVRFFPQTVSTEPALHDVPLPNRLRWLLLVAGVLPVVLLAILAEGNWSTLSAPRYRLASIPSLAVTMALFVNCRRCWTLAITVATVLVSTWSFAGYRPWVFPRLGHVVDQSWVQMHERIHQHQEPTAAVFVQSGLVESTLVPAMFESRLFLDYTGCRLRRPAIPAAVPRFGLPFSWAVNPDCARHFERLLADLASQPPQTIWLAAATDTDLNRASAAGFEVLALRAGWQRIEREEFPGALLVRFRRE